MSARFVHTADWQLGMKGGRLGEAAAAVTGTRVETVRRLLEATRSRGIDTVLACGDLFEHNQVADALIEATAAAIADFPDIVVHAIPGNHDVPGAGSVWRRRALAGLENLRLHERPYDGTPVEIAAGVFLHAFPVITRYDNEDPLAALPDLRGHDGIHVAMAHGHLTTETFGGHEDDVILPLDPRHVSRSGLDYLALGHWHGLKVVESDGATRIAYSGTHEPTHFRETDPGQILVVEITEKGVPPALDRVHVARLDWARRSFRLDDPDDVLDMEAALISDDADILEIRLTGSLDASVGERVETAVEAARRGREFVAVVDEVDWRSGTEEEIEDPLLQSALAAIDCGEDAAAALQARRLLREWSREEAGS